MGPGIQPRNGVRGSHANPVDGCRFDRPSGRPPRSVGIVSVNGRAAKKADVLPDRALVKVFHPIFGG